MLFKKFVIHLNFHEKQTGKLELRKWGEHYTLLVLLKSVRPRQMPSC
jgi:hypothetical protein